VLPQAQLCGEYIDRRLDIYSQAVMHGEHGCRRPSEIELPVDYHGDLHLCCGDWQGEVPIGTIRDPADAVARWLVIADLTPHFEVCGRCASLKHGPRYPL